MTYAKTNELGIEKERIPPIEPWDVMAEKERIPPLEPWDVRAEKDRIPPIEPWTFAPW
jgi:hypothetical protein